jgi:hypothetical protein
MKAQMESFLRMVGMSLGIGVVYEVAPLIAQRIEASIISDLLKGTNGEAPETELLYHEHTHCKVPSASDC